MPPIYISDRHMLSIDSSFRRPEARSAAWGLSAVAAARQRADIAQCPIAQMVAGRLHLSAGFVAGPRGH
jgi:hypothetical protein